MKHLTHFEQYVNEAFLHEQAAVYKTLMLHPEKWVHFTNIKKLGINPSEKTVHRDPPAIYTYPVSWLLDNKEKLREGQYGFNHKYFYIVDIDTTIRDLNLSSLTEEDGREIAVRNGWGQYYETYTTHWEHYKPASFCRINTTTPGGKFYYIASQLRNTNKFTWLQMLRGYESFSDDLGIINKNEPHQRNVFSIRNITIIDFGINKWANPTYDILQLVATIMGDAKVYRKHNYVHIVGSYNGGNYEAYASDKANCHSFSKDGDIAMNTLYLKDGSQSWEVCDMELDANSNDSVATNVAEELRLALDKRTE